MKRFFTFLLLGMSLSPGFSQSSLWTARPDLKLEAPTQWPQMPEDHLAYELILKPLQEQLALAPEPYQGQQPIEIVLPGADGQLLRFAVTRSLTLPAALEARYPGIRTYQGRGIDHPGQQLRVELTPKGFHAMISEAGQTSFIEPHSGNLHLAYRSGPIVFGPEGFICEQEEFPLDPTPGAGQARLIGQEILVYRTAIAGDQLYTAFHGGVTGALAAIAVVLNRVNGIFEREMGVQLQLIPNNDLIIYDGPDPYTQGDNGLMINENQANLDAVIGSANYDIGHVFTQIISGSVGRAFLASVCRSTTKGGGVSGLSSPVGDNFILPAVVHEMGHQFSATHTFNTNTTLNNCGPNRTGATAYEPGSGSTIMSYAGACPPHNVASGPEDYYHGGSLAQMHAYTRTGLGNGCATVINTGNQEPVISMQDGGFFIPRSTPFELIGIASDPEGNSLTYGWDQVDLGAGGHPNSPVGDAPLFRSFQPTPDSRRIFPLLNRIVTNTQQIGEILPDYARNMSFRLTVRDLTGGVAQEDLEFEVAGNAGPFVVSYPNSPAPSPWTGGSFENIQWEVANTDRSPVNCQAVNIHLSTDGGFTYPILLAENVPNTGSAWVQLPEISSTNCRIRIQAADNIFFDISNSNFTINAPAAPGVGIYPIDDPGSLCAGSETSYTLYTSSLQGFSDSTVLSTPGLLPGVTAIFTPPVFVPGDTVLLQLSGGDSLAAGTYPVTILAFSPNAGVSEIINLSLTVSDPILVSAITPLGPINYVGQGVDNPSFSWEVSPEADVYLLEVATSPTFGGSTIYVNEQVPGANLSLPFSLAEGSTYYWRVRGNNACGEGPFGATQAFQTGQCAEQVSVNVPVTIPLFGSPNIVTSTLPVTSNTAISSIKVVGVRGIHSSIDDLEMILRSPQGIEVVLFSQICGNDDADFDFNFAEGGATTFDCPPTNGETYQPQESLSAFVGQFPGGPWTLRIQDVLNFEGGELQGWGLEICSAGADAPQLITNEPLQTQRWALDTLETNLLEASDASGNPADISFTILNLPQYGGVLLDGANLSVGDAFTQADLNQQRVSYLHNGSDAVIDSFRFDLSNPAGGWNGVFSFQLVIAQTTGINNSLPGVRLQAFPNPVQDELTVQLSGLSPEAVSLELYSLHGQLVQQLQAQPVAGAVTRQLPLQNLSAGMYLLRVSQAQGSKVLRVVKE